MKIKKVVFTCISYVLLTIVFLVSLIPFLIITLIPMKYRLKSKLIGMMTYFFYWAVLKCLLVPIKYVGLKNVPREPAIFVANHQSPLDIPLLGVTAGFTPRVWLATSELLQFYAYWYWLARVAVMVNTSSPQQAMRSLVSTIQIVRDKNCHVMIFPEGARYIDDHVHEFFGGFVILAKKLNRPVVPVCIIGANKVFPPNAFWISRHKIQVIVGPPFYYRDEDTDETFKQRVHQWFVDLVGAA